MGSFELPPNDPAAFFRELEQRVRALERTRPIPVGSGPPTHAARDGTPYLDEDAGRLYVRRNGTWGAGVAL